MIDNYKIVFKDILETYLESNDIVINKEQKNKIIHNLIFKYDEIFELVVNYIQYEIERIKEG